MKPGRKLLFSVTKKDLEVTFYASPGPGGQNKNKVKNACRIKHPASGALVTAQERRERPANIKAALHRLVDHPKFKVWWRKKCWEVENKMTVEEYVDDMMEPYNLKVETLKDDKWVPEGG